MQSIVRSFYTQAALVGSSRRVMTKVMPRQASILSYNHRHFAAALEVKSNEEVAIDLDQRNKRLGVDTVFNE